MLIDAPAPDILEISIFSRGYGECIVVHVGNGDWMVIDSHKDDTGVPVALAYLEKIGVPFERVVAILLTHWHDDHIDGAAHLVKMCPDAIVALSGLLQRDEFASFIMSNGAPDAGSFGSGVKELTDVLDITFGREQKRKWCWSERIILSQSGDATYQLEALSPSDKDFEQFLLDISAVAAGANGRLASPRRNDSSVASVLSSPFGLMLFGADLEVGSLGSGWKAVHTAAWRARGKADFFKVAHHGSSGADYPPVWADMIADGATAALTPWNRGSKLPTQDDVDRILNYTAEAYAAAKPRPIKKPAKINAVERSLRESNIKVTSGEIAQGHLRMRKSQGGNWEISLDGAATHLSTVLK